MSTYDAPYLVRNKRIYKDLSLTPIPQSMATEKTIKEKTTKSWENSWTTMEGTSTRTKRKVLFPILKYIRSLEKREPGEGTKRLGPENEQSKSKT